MNNYNNTNQASPPPHQTEGFESLMGSLISPAPTTPLQTSLQSPWAQMGWPHSNGQINYGFSMPFAGSPLSTMAWNTNTQNGIVEPEDEDEDMHSVDDTGVKNENSQYSGQTGSMADQSQAVSGQPYPSASQLMGLNCSSPLAPQSKVHNQVKGNLRKSTQSPKVKNEARAAELRAKLLASKIAREGSRQESPVVKLPDESENKAPTTQALVKQLNGSMANTTETRTASAVKQIPSATVNGAPESLVTGRASATAVSDIDFANLFAQAQIPHTATQSDQKPSDGSARNAARLPGSAEDGSDVAPSINPGLSSQQMMGRDTTSPMLSEPGEILSRSPSPTKLPQMSRTEAENAKLATEEKQEKLTRQSEVSKAYQPLKKSEAPISAPKITSRTCSPKQTAAQEVASGLQTKVSDQSKRIPVASEARPGSNKDNPKAKALQKRSNQQPEAREESRRDQLREQAYDYNRRDNFNDLRRTSISQTFLKPLSIQQEAQERRERTENNSRRASEYKKQLEAQRPEFRKGSMDDSTRSAEPSQLNGTDPVRILSSADNPMQREPVPSVTNDKSNEAFRHATKNQREADIDMLSPTAQAPQENSELNDWLEATNYYDLNYRKRRLALHQRKKALDKQREELEREECELQGIAYVTRAASTSVVNSPQTARHSISSSKMEPPPTPFKDANANEADIKPRERDPATPAAPPPFRKRPHDEDDRESRRMQPAEKLPRLDTTTTAYSSYHPPATATTSPTSAPPVVKEEPLPLEHRIARSNSMHYPPRGRARTRSPLPGRRSSREYSPGFPNAQSRPPICYSCGQRGHTRRTCNEPQQAPYQAHSESQSYRPPPRLGGEGRSANAAADDRPGAAYKQWVSPNYLGRNPVVGFGTRGGRSRTQSPHIRSGGGGGERERRVQKIDGGALPYDEGQIGEFNNGGGRGAGGFSGGGGRGRPR
ncbi:hypothetical protein MMC21_002701 [Puttea exsequens]|nr:hypothetical protein [Puttea exsequens]